MFFQLATSARSSGRKLLCLGLKYKFGNFSRAKHLLVCREGLSFIKIFTCFCEFTTKSRIIKPRYVLGLLPHKNPENLGNQEWRPGHLFCQSDSVIIYFKLDLFKNIFNIYLICYLISLHDILYNFNLD